MKAGRPLLPTGRGERYSQTIILNVKQRSCTDATSPYNRKCWINAVGPLKQSLLWALCSDPQLWGMQGVLKIKKGSLHCYVAYCREGNPGHLAYNFTICTKHHDPYHKSRAGSCLYSLYLSTLQLSSDREEKKMGKIFCKSFLWKRRERERHSIPGSFHLVKDIWEAGIKFPFMSTPPTQPLLPYGIFWKTLLKGFCRSVVQCRYSRCIQRGFSVQRCHRPFVAEWMQFDVNTSEN